MIYLGADHGGFALKEKVKNWLSEWNIAYEDCGALALDSGDDYPDYAHAVSAKVSQNPNENKGILFCRSGGGMEITANKHSGIRAEYIFDEKSAVHARTHNDANIAAIAGDWISEETAKQAIELFLQTPFSKIERHERRIKKIEAI